MRDGGYDISDYYAVLPEYGSIADFKDFLSAAHERSIRVIADLVVNHTSDRHPWFLESRSSSHSAKRKLVCVERFRSEVLTSPDHITDTERSNWTWDEQAGAFYWHRFFSHQPDLNYDNSEVRQAMLEVVSFWLDLGVDGFRVDAAPYLFEREETNCENLPETPEFLKQLRKFVDERYPDVLLLAEANQWPEDVVQYFGVGVTTHSGNFHKANLNRLASRRNEQFQLGC